MNRGVCPYVISLSLYVLTRSNSLLHMSVPLFHLTYGTLKKYALYKLLFCSSFNIIFDFKDPESFQSKLLKMNQ